MPSAKPPSNDPIQHLKIIENSLLQTLFQEYDLSKNPSLMV